MNWFKSESWRHFCAISCGLSIGLIPSVSAGESERVQKSGSVKADSLRKPAVGEWGARLNLRPGTVDPRDSEGERSAVKATVSGEVEKEPGKAAGAPLAIPLVQGYDSFGLNLPDYDPQGRLRSVFVIGAMSRVDDRNVEIRESFLETYAEDGSPEFAIDLPKAVLDRFTRVLVAKTPVTLRKTEFELKGASLEFNTVTKEGGLGGPVQMTIYNAKPASEPSQNIAPPPRADGSRPSGPR